MAFAVTLSVKTGVAMARLHPIPVKKHGRRAWSLFALGLYTLRKIFAAASPAQIIAFLDQLFPKTTLQIPAFFGIPIGSRVLWTFPFVLFRGEKTNDPPIAFIVILSGALGALFKHAYAAIHLRIFQGHYLG